MSEIFISYGHDGSAKYAVPAIREQLSQHFGAESVFRDIDSMEPGVDFVEEIEQAVGSCKVLIVVIGREWLSATDKHGKRRLENPEDWVRLELETALKRKVLVVPALIDGAAMPLADELPESLKKFSRRHAIEIDHKRFGDDVKRLVQVLEKIVPRQGGGGSLPKEPEIQAAPIQSVKKRDGMVLISKGPFFYGEERESKVIPYDYWMDQCPVTNQQFQAFLQAGGYSTEMYWSEEGWAWKTKEKVSQPRFWEDPQWNKASHPAMGVSYYEAEAYAKWAGKRLSTEEEWEKAARGTDGREYPWGNDFDPTNCNTRHSRNNGTSPVPAYPNGKSPFECYDMTGNVWEWCDSWYDEDLDAKVLRGGSWLINAPRFLRASYRYWFRQTFRVDDAGFRCVRDAS